MIFLVSQLSSLLVKIKTIFTFFLKKIHSATETNVWIILLIIQILILILQLIILNSFIAPTMNFNYQREIIYCEPQGHYGELSNFYISPFTHNGLHYKTNQHFYQSKKFQGTQRQHLIINSPTPYDAFALGNDKTAHLRHGWRGIKEKIMKDGLRLKFTLHPTLLQKLLATGNAEITQHSASDSYWSDGGDGSGKNRMGVILMELREQMRLHK